MGLRETKESNLNLSNSNHHDRGTRVSVIWLLCCSALMANARDVRAPQEGSGQTSIEVLHVPELDAGFHLLYQLKFEEARAQFAVRESSHPEDSLGSAAEAASYLFEECYREGVLTSEFFLDNKRFLEAVA